MVLAFDLDGTISDAALGITSSINYALEKMGHPARDPASLNIYIGPPLQDIFGGLLNTEEAAVVRAAVTFFRERYFSVGYKENVLYPGMMDVIRELKRSGHTLYIATAKRTDIARAVTDYFGITACFEEVMGCGLKRKKATLLHEIEARDSETPLMMIGDRSQDMIAGKQTGCPCIGVLWGYGTRKELLDAGADKLVETPRELASCIEHWR